ncbi:MAG: class II aldolase/adducin family protein [Leptolyngbya sp. DLM2.Bin27]|nr:MAG: class II aldolase/adducin family protein [Leptolyngbya sp. DLM2.Bin27]
MATKGFIKYKCEWSKTDAVKDTSILEINPYRNALYQLNFIREDSDGTGVGNISQRIKSDSLGNVTPQFIISGSQTGRLHSVKASDYAIVTSFVPEENRLTCEGMRKASSESLTHGVIYSSDPGIGAVIHVHNSKIWKGLLDQAPSTRSEIAYGTPEMAEETQRLFQESNLSQVKIFAMAGHKDGIVSFGENLKIAYDVLIEWGLRTGLFTLLDSEAALRLPGQLIA